MASKRHTVYFGRTTKGETILKCSCGYETQARTREDAVRAHNDYKKAVTTK